MRVVPVIDLKAGTAVHAVRGERESYRPVRSVIAGADGDALALAHAFRAQLGLDELYVADLDAIGGAGDRERVAPDRAIAFALAAHGLDRGAVLEIDDWNDAHAIGG